MGKGVVRYHKAVSMIRRLLKWRPTPLRIIVIYVIVGGLWMLLSDEVLRAAVSDPMIRGRLEMLTDWLYVVATAWMLYALIQRNVAATQEALEALQQSEEQFRQLAEHVQEAFWMSTPDQDRFTYVSPVYEEIWGYPRESLYDHIGSWLDAIHPEDREGVIAALEKRSQGEYDEVYRVVRPDGTVRWVHDRAFPIRNKHGRIYRVCGVMQDITEQVLARERLEQRVEERTREIERRREVAEGLRDILSVLNSDQPWDKVLDFIVARSGQLLDSSGVAICRLQNDGGSVVVQAATGLLEEYEVGTSLPIGRETLEQMINECRPVTISDTGAFRAAEALAPTIDNEVSAGSRQHDQIPLIEQRGAVLAVPLLVKGEIYGELVLYYPTPRRISQEEMELAVTLADHAALAIENARLRTQVRQAAAAAERNRLARDLHDSVTQALYSMTLYAEAAGMAMSAGKQGAVAQNLQELRNMAREAMLDMRMLLFELHPPVLEEEGLVAALQARLAAVEARAGLQAEVHAEGDRRLPLALEEELFWIAEEALNNAVKHAKAQQITVHLRFDDAGVCIEVKDDGPGFDVASAKQGGGMGMRGIEERVRRIKGKLDIVSTPEKGTTVRVAVQT